MDYYKKQRIREKFRQSRWIIIGTGSFGLAGLIVMLVGFYVGGWDIWQWITGPLGTSFFIMIGFFIFGSMWIAYIWFIKKDKQP